MKNIILRGEIYMSKKMTDTKIKMAAIGNNMMEVGQEIYIDPTKDNKLNKPLKKESK